METPFKAEDKLMILDFDHTCYDTDDFLLNEIRRPMLELFDIPKETWEKSYRITADNGYSLEKHLSELEIILGKAPCTVEEIKNIGEKIDFEKYLYGDVLPFIKKAKSMGYKIMILSFGDPIWQDKKVLGSGLDKVVDLIRYTVEDKYKTKAEMIKTYINGCERAIFVDNKGSNLDAVHEMLPQVETYLINRVPLEAMNFGARDDLRIKYMESRLEAIKKTNYAHKACTNLSEINI